jgi:prefoldin subunit 5
MTNEIKDAAAEYWEQRKRSIKDSLAKYKAILARLEDELTELDRRLANIKQPPEVALEK